MSRVPGAGRSPAGNGPWMARSGGAGHACAVADGPAATDSAGAGVTEAAEPARAAMPLLQARFSLCPDGQELPTAATVGHTQSRTGGGDAMINSKTRFRIMSIMSI